MMPRRFTRQELGAVAMLSALLLVILSQLPGLLRTNVEVSALDRHPDLRLEALAAEFGARYSIPLMIRAVAPEADVIVDRTVDLDERVLLPDHLIAIGGARGVLVDVSSDLIEPRGRFAGRTHAVGWTMDVVTPGAGPDDRPVVRIVPVPTMDPGDQVLHVEILQGRDVQAPLDASEGDTASGSLLRHAMRDGSIVLGLLALGAVLIGRSWPDVDWRGRELAIALLVGASLVTVATGLLLVVGAPTGGVAVGASALALALIHRRFAPRRVIAVDGTTVRLGRPTAKTLGVGSFLIAAVVALSRALRSDGIISLTPDSITLLSQAEMLATNTAAVAFLAPDILAKRILSVPALHALGGPGAGPVVVLGPLLLATVGLLTSAIAHRMARRRLAAVPSLLIAGIAGASVVTVERMLTAALYVNSHALVAAAVLGMVLVALDERLPIAVLGPLAALVALSRAEGALLAALVLLGSSLARERGQDVAQGAGPWLWLAGATVLRQAIILRAEFGTGSVAAPTLAMLAVGLALTAAPWLLGRAGYRGRLMLASWGILALWGGLGAALLLDVGPARASLRATLVNVLDAGGWGPLLVVLGGGAMLALLRAKEDEFLPLAVPWLGFIPLGLVLAVLRGGAYRVGSGDSLNRMWIHLLPLLVLLIVLAVIGRVQHGMPRSGTDESVHGRTGSVPMGAGGMTTLLLAFAMLFGAVTFGASAGRMTELSRPVTLPAGLDRHEPVGELLAGRSVEHTLRAGLPPLVTVRDLDEQPLCIQLFAATYEGRANAGSLAVEVVGPSDRYADTVDMSLLRDNEWTLACPEGLQLGHLEGLREGGLLRVAGIDGRAGSSATLWATRDTTNGTLGLEPVGLVHRFVVLEHRRQSLPAVAVGIALGALVLAGLRRPWLTKGSSSAGRGCTP